MTENNAPADKGANNEAPKGDNKGDNNPGGLSPEQLKVAFEHPRFKELAQSKKELDDLKAKLAKDEDEKLAKNQEYQKLLEKRDAELTEARTKASELQLQVAIEREAVKAGVTDTEAAIKLIDRSKVQVDKEGNITGIADAVKALVEARPYLVTGKPAVNIGNGTNPEQPTGTSHPISWVRQQWANPTWVRAKHEEYGNITGEEYLNKIEKEGRIDYQA